jgi:hypothetical protein
MINTAVIVEPRLHKYLKPVIDNVIRNINIDTPIQIFHSKINEKFIKDNYKNEIDNNKIILTKIILNKREMDNLTIQEYNLLLTSLDFWNKINGEYILIFQTDSCFCNHINTFDFTEFIKNGYGFIGAPNLKQYPVPRQNGGFSIRRKSLMIKAINANKEKCLISRNEDIYYTKHQKHIVNPAPYDLAEKFSVEKFYYNNPLALHKTWIYIKENEWNELKIKFPEISLTFDF